MRRPTIQEIAAADRLIVNHGKTLGNSASAQNRQALAFGIFAALTGNYGACPAPLRAIADLPDSPDDDSTPIEPEKSLVGTVEALEAEIEELNKAASKADELIATLTSELGQAKEDLANQAMAESDDEERQSVYMYSELKDKSVEELRSMFYSIPENATPDEAAKILEAAGDGVHEWSDSFEIELKQATKADMLDVLLSM
jgi:hypothetical protein